MKASSSTCTSTAMTSLASRHLLHAPRTEPAMANPDAKIFRSTAGLPARRAIGPKARHRSQQANSYKTPSTITGMLRAVGSWRLGGRRNGRKWPRRRGVELLCVARRGGPEREDERRRKRTQYRFSDSGSFSIPSTIRTVRRRQESESLPSPSPPPLFLLNLLSFVAIILVSRRLTADRFYPPCSPFPSLPPTPFVP